ncbi:MAG: AMIN domain-containing protein, partial [Gammaproteobacteria bacterium]|nr:AMIN domain-containing protein [Gammaproteobacteria bacterium]
MSHELNVFARINALCQRVFVGIFVVWLALAQAEAASQVTGARLWTGDGKQQFIFDVSAHMKIHSFSLLKPSRLVLDLSDAEFRRPLPALDLSATNVKKVRIGSPKKSVARIVFDLDAPLKWKVTPLAAKGP